MAHDIDEIVEARLAEKQNFMDKVISVFDGN
jgi:hypothetical protein